MLSANGAVMAACSNDNTAAAAPTTPPPSRGYVERVRQLAEAPASSRSATVGTTSTSASGGSDADMVREYTVWPAKNTFCCWGFFMTGPEEDVGPNICAWATILTPMALFFYTWGDALSQQSRVLLVTMVLSFASVIFWLLVTSLTDPGILARNADAPVSKDPPHPYRRRVDDDGNTFTDTWCSACAGVDLGTSRRRTLSPSASASCSQQESPRVSLLETRRFFAQAPAKFIGRRVRRTAQTATTAYAISITIARSRGTASGRATTRTSFASSPPYLLLLRFCSSAVSPFQGWVRLGRARGMAQQLNMAVP